MPKRTRSTPPVDSLHAVGVSRPPALTTTGALLLSALARAVSRAPEQFEVTGTRTRAGRHWLLLPLDETGRERARRVPIRARSGKPVTAVVASTTGLATVGTAESRPDPRGAVSVPLGPGGQATVWVTPRRAGSPGVPADVLTVRTPTEELAVEVWIEPLGGQWQPAGPDGSPLDLDIVATHAALVRGAAGDPELVMWSLARMRNPDGSPMPDPRRPSEWLWNFWEMADVEARALDTGTLRTRDRDMAADGVTMCRNIFCAGNAHLPDGRVLVAGGHLTPTDKPQRRVPAHLRPCRAGRVAGAGRPTGARAVVPDRDRAPGRADADHLRLPGDPAPGRRSRPGTGRLLEQHQQRLPDLRPRDRTAARHWPGHPGGRGGAGRRRPAAGDLPVGVRPPRGRTLGHRGGAGRDHPGRPARLAADPGPGDAAGAVRRHPAGRRHGAGQRRGPAGLGRPEQRTGADLRAVRPGDRDVPAGRHRHHRAAVPLDRPATAGRDRPEGR